MMVNTPRGMFIITNIPRDLSELCREYISDEVADLVYASITEVENGKLYEEMKFNSDFSAIEGENEFYRDKLFEIKSGLETLIYEMEHSKRLNRDELYTSLNNMVNEINKDL